MDRIGNYQIKPFTKHRQNIVLVTKEGWRKHTVHATIEVDVTDARKKIHEILISEDEARNVKVFDGTYVILPQFFETQDVHDKYNKSPSISDSFVYRSDRNDRWLTVGDLRQMIEDLKDEENEADPLCTPAYR